MLSSLVGMGLVGNWRERGAIGAVGKVGLPLGDDVVKLVNGVVGRAARDCDFEKGVVGNWRGLPVGLGEGELRPRRGRRFRFMGPVGNLSDCGEEVGLNGGRVVLRKVGDLSRVCVA